VRQILNDDGTCPKCATTVDHAPKPATEGESAPWHFKLMVVALVVYLGWRFVEFF